MVKLADLPLSRPALNKRAPNRKPRVGRQTIKVLKIGKQETFLSLIRAGETYDRAKVRCRLAAVTLYNWRRDPEFVQRCDEAKQFAIDSAEGRLQGLLPRAVSVTEETLEGEDAKLKWDAAHKVLRGRGLLRDADNPPMNVTMPITSFVFVLPDGTRVSPKELGSGNPNSA